MKDKGKKIKESQIEAILQTVYQTNIAAQTFDALKKLLLELPEIEAADSSESKDLA
jgi:hypothetical protein